MRQKSQTKKQTASDKTLIVKIEKIVPNGFGLAFAENLTVFVPLAAEGDELRVRVNQTKGKTAFAEIVEILKPSPDRTEPRCEYFGACGGCDFQQLNYEAQLRAKVGIVRDCLTRIGRINYEREIEIIKSPNDYEYRSRAQWHADTRREKLGYFQRKSHSVIDVKRCPILAPDLEATLETLRSEIEWKTFFEEIIEIEAATAAGKTSVYSAELIEPTLEIFYEVNGGIYRHDARSFFQGNLFLIEPLIETATGGASGANALDLYCGVGLFTLPLARKFANVKGVEDYNLAIDFAEKNAETARLSNVEFHSQNVADFLEENAEKLKNVDFVLLDPPRAGTEKKTIEKLLEIAPPEISYVSCEPSILARDLKILTEEKYRIESIVALDLFPQTHHVETVARLARK